MKRLVDLILALVGLVLLSPLLALIAIAILVSDGSPVLYTQTRIGKGFAPFTMYKFRTMQIKNEGPQITSQGDPRVTRVGQALRSVKLDELPQLINVAKGDMALVGPRPEVPQYVEHFRQDFAVILTVRPGITGAASLEFRNESEILDSADDPHQTYVEDVLPEKIAIERQYVANRSMATDLGILTATITGFFR
jgi:lipopolysaccharide/colanic/teichoic acid biosynthesis glycosyltransferase